MEDRPASPVHWLGRIVLEPQDKEDISLQKYKRLIKVQKYQNIRIQPSPRWSGRRRARQQLSPAGLSRARSVLKESFLLFKFQNR